jgi:SsrA-binding protein
MANKNPEKRVIAENRKAFYEYHILDRFEAGLVLTGTEVKSLRFQSASLVDAHCDMRSQGLVLLNCYIPEYKAARVFNHEPRRPRILLLHRNELRKLLGKIKTKGMTMVPLQLYFNAKGIAKIELAVVQGKKQHDKREAEKNRDWQRSKARVLRQEGE